jgi:chromosomal replication initiation ATPase DnaA
MKRWLSVVDQLREELNEHSFASFIEPLKLTRVRGGKITLSAPPDSVSWVADHYSDRIRDVYREKNGKEVEVEVE